MGVTDTSDSDLVSPSRKLFPNRGRNSLFDDHPIGFDESNSGSGHSLIGQLLFGALGPGGIRMLSPVPPTTLGGPQSPVL